MKKRPRGITVRSFFVLALAYALLATLGMRWASVHGLASPVWLATGVALAALVIGGTRLWPTVLLGAFLAFIVDNPGLGWLNCLLLASGNTLAAVAGAVTLQRVEFNPALNKSRDAFALCVVGTAGVPVLSALVGATVLMEANGLSADATRATWFNWWLGDTAGVLVGAPLVLAWREWPRHETLQWWVQLFACLAFACFAGWFVFLSNTNGLPMSWFAFLPLLWAALAFQARGAVITFVIVSFAVWGTAVGHGPFAINGNPSDLLFLQQFVAVAAATALILAAAVDEQRAKDALQASEQRLTMALEAGQLGFWDWNIATGQVHFGGRWASMLGYRDDEVAPRAEWWRRLLHPDDVGHMAYKINEYLDGRSAFYECEYRLRHKDGFWRWMLDRGQIVERDAQGKPLRAIGTRVDITERRAAEVARRKTQALLHAVIDGSTALVFAKDLQGRYFLTNKAWRQMTGVSEEAAANVTDDDVFGPEIAAVIRANDERVLQTRQPLVIEETAVLQGERVIYLSSKFPLLDEAGEPYAVCGVSSDISRLKRLEEAMKIADRRKDEFLATLAHELRNPLSPIRTGLQVLKMTPSDSVVAAEVREMMERQLAQLVHLVDDLLDVSRVTRGKITLRIERVKVADIVATAVEACRPMLDEKQHQLDIAPIADTLYVNGDTTRLVQVLSNLLTNAAKYTEAGGHIRIDVDVDRARQLSRERGVRNEYTDHEYVNHEYVNHEYVNLHVTDNGPGIVPALLPGIWDMFTQVRDTVDRAQGGLGIGLSLVKMLVEMHGGEVNVLSAPGQGSCFSVRLPLLPAQPVADAAAPIVAKDADAEIAAVSAAAPAAHGASVLVVDDNVDAADTLAMMLRLGGHVVTVVHNGRDALRAVQNTPPDLVFLDIGLPGMNGYEVARQMRSLPQTAHAMLVALTGWGGEQDRQRSHEAGFDIHLTKPADHSAIEAVMAQLAERQVKPGSQPTATRTSPQHGTQIAAVDTQS